MQGKKEDSADAIRLNRRHRNSAHEAGTRGVGLDRGVQAVKRVRMALIMARKNRDPYAEASAMASWAKTARRWHVAPRSTWRTRKRS